MTCKDCVHYGVCEDAREFDNYEVYDIICDHAKNKADFVEVVRCKDCKYFVPDAYVEPYCQIWTDKVGQYRDFDCDTTEDNYCSYGERKS